MHSSIKLSLATSLVLALASPAAASGYPRVSVGGYLASNYELESLIPYPHQNSAGKNIPALHRLPFHVGQISLTANYDLSSNIGGIVELLPRAKGKPDEYRNEYQDIVGNGVDVPLSVLGRAEATIRGLWCDSAFTVGQLRVPFGLWDDFSVHSKLFVAKNDTTILGSGLRRIDSGMKLEGNLWPDGVVNYRLAAMGRSNSVLVNNLELSDYVARLGMKGVFGEVGFNGYVADVSRANVGTKGALSLDYTLFLPLNLTFIGEYVLMADTNVGADVQGYYTRLNYDLGDWFPGLRSYVGYERSTANIGANQGVEQKEVAGLRYKIAPGCTLGGDVIYGNLYPEGNFIARLETLF